MGFGGLGEYEDPCKLFIAVSVNSIYLLAFDYLMILLHAGCL